LCRPDNDHEFHFEGTPIRPLVAADATGVVVSIGTLSKAFAPGVRVGWVVAPPQVVERLIHWRNLVDRQGDRVVEHAVAELLEDGTLERHLRRVRRLYAERRAALRAALADALPELDVEVPSGGLALWARAPGVDVARWSAEAASRGVAFDPSTAFDLVGDAEPAARFGFPAHDPPELREAVARVAAALRAL
jgi:GntR family transcriptional regulator/MocR family aminotransferase